MKWTWSCNSHWTGLRYALNLFVWGVEFRVGLLALLPRLVIIIFLQLYALRRRNERL
uniref:Uncharacterized protein n=1 Tax=Rhizophora mucronata TaxID=61149 RepID=A0A2P2Q512_RHIMU